MATLLVMTPTEIASFLTHGAALYEPMPMVAWFWAWVALTPTLGLLITLGGFADAAEEQKW